LAIATEPPHAIPNAMTVAAVWTINSAEEQNVPPELAG